MEKVAVGVMSGTSLDGLDLALVKFNFNESWSFEVLDTRFIPYTNCWEGRLKNAMKLPAEELLLLHNEYGDFIGEKVVEFIRNRKVDLVASHGHTVFHQPDKKMTFQLGNGANIAAKTKMKVINDFRVLDVALGGQGAPLVPVGDLLLFSEYSMCLNLGGFANVSVKNEDGIIAYDICAVNIVLNKLANELGLPYDKNGRIAASGQINIGLLDKLNNIEFYAQKPPKSLGKEWSDEMIVSVLSQVNDSVENKIATYTKHVVDQLTRAIESHKGKILVTGGGAYNQTIINGLEEKFDDRIVIPEQTIIDFKEAVLFAFLGVLRDENTHNCLKTVTGADVDNIGGSIWQG